MKRNLATRLDTALSAQELKLIRIAALEAEGLGFGLYIVGGLPRDIILGRAPTDFDLVVEGNAIELGRLLGVKYGGQVAAHPHFKTAKWQADKARLQEWLPNTRSSLPGSVSHLDLISARSETYPRAAQLPHVRLGSIGEDLRRRDFTINALAIRVDGGQFGEILDPVGAIDDIRRRTIRVLHDQSFRDDPTRMFRAVRYEQRLGFRITPETLRLIPAARKWIPRLSAQRVRHELDQVLAEVQAANMVRRLGQLRILGAVHRALPADRRALRRLRPWQPRRTTQEDASKGRGNTRQWLLWLLDLSPAQIQSVRRRLHFDNALTEALLAATRLFRRMKQSRRLRPSQLAKQLAALPLLAVEVVHDSLPDRRARNQLEQYLTTWRHVRALTTGHDLRRLGIEPGPTYGRILEELRSAWIDGKIQSAAQERQMLEKHLHRLSHPSAAPRARRAKRPRV